jgi:hypothetical protein
MQLSSLSLLTAVSQLAMVMGASRSNMEATRSIFDERLVPPFSNLSRISEIMSGMGIGFTRISSACKRMASIASFNAGYPVNSRVTASGCL